MASSTTDSLPALADSSSDEEARKRFLHYDRRRTESNRRKPEHKEAIASTEVERTNHDAKVNSRSTEDMLLGHIHKADPLGHADEWQVTTEKISITESKPDHTKNTTKYHSQGE